jgi:putative CocE/NonD family hydrolase
MTFTAPSRPQTALQARVTRDVRMTTSDGIHLAMDLYFPARLGQTVARSFPVVLERTPYGRALDRLQRFGQDAAARGYVFVCQDVRGRGDSGGEFHLMTNEPDEGADGADTFDWLRSQPWCDGRIATVGGSFSAANQQALALRRPPGLTAQVLRDCGTNYWRRMFRNHGAFNVGVVLPWILTYGLESRPAIEDVSVRSSLEAMRDDIGEWLPKLPLRRGQSPLALVPEYEGFYFKMLETADETAYWHNPTVMLEGRWDEYPTDVAVLMISGWYAHHAAANFDKFQQFGQRLRQPLRLIVGPWVHSPEMLEMTRTGEVDFGPAAARMGPIHTTWLDWLDRSFHGSSPAQHNPERRLDYFVMGLGNGRKTSEGLLFHGGEWRSASAWPLPGTAFTPFYLTPTGHLRTKAPTESASFSRYAFDPLRPCPGIGSTSLQSQALPAFVLPGPRDQRCRPDFAGCEGNTGPLSARPDVLSFETAVLRDDIEITGPLTVHLWVATSAPDTDFVAKLVDVYPASDDFPEGFALLVTDGVLRMRYRGGRTRGELVVPGREYAIEIELCPTSNVFKAGHRIRLDITSSCFPQYDVNPNTGEPLGLHSRTEVAHQSVFHDESRSSYVLLPIQPSSVRSATCR